VRCKSRTNCSTPAAAATRFSSSTMAIDPAGSKILQTIQGSKQIRGAGKK
jgi:hypothetical protein